MLAETNVAKPVMAQAVLELTVFNHAGVMTHVCGLFARRAFNMEGILCMPVGDGSRSRIWLLVREDENLPQVIKQIEKLVDVISVARHPGDHEAFQGLDSLFNA